MKDSLKAAIIKSALNEMISVAKFFRWLTVLFFAIFLVRAIDLMLIRGGYFRKLADYNRIRKLKIPSARGRILDSSGLELARNSVKYLDDQGKEVPRDQALVIEANQKQNLDRVWVREYPYGEAFADITGYLGETTREEVDSDRQPKLDLGDLVGRGGLEQFYDYRLRGVPGERLVEVGATGEVVRELGRKDPVAGEDLRLNIDSCWQNSSWQALSGHKGAVVVLEPKTGAILALVSYPSFDPNLFTKWRDEEKINSLLEDQNLPFLNRAIGGAYHPGSTFKIVTAVAGLEEGEIDAQKEIEDTGVIEIEQWRFGNWYWLEYGRKEGTLSLVRAIKRSNDIYFYKVGEWLGAENLLKWAKKFGFGQETGVDLPGEVAGFLPSPEWKEEARGERWFLGNTYHLAIGQGDLTATPMQIAVETAIVANGGFWCRPKLLSPLSEFENNCTNEILKIKKENLELIKEGMAEACSSGGTGFPLFGFKPPVACKTGTAEVGNIDKDAHAWFTLFYPVEEPKVVITVLVEKGGSGAYVAAPIAKKIIEGYEGREIKN